MSQHQPQLHETDRPLPATLHLLIALGLGLLFASYVLLRYGGLWGEIDTTTFALAIQQMISSEQLIPDVNRYANGYGYQVLATFLSQISGAPIGFIQRYAAILLAIWIIPPAWLLYRELVGSARGATLATLFLLVQPELLFVLARGTHEKFTRGLMLLSLFLLIRSLRSTDRLSRFASLIICFYLCIYAVIAFNTFLANSFVLAVLLALVLCWVVIREQPLSLRPAAQAEVLVQRLLFASVICLILVFAFIFYIYPPAQISLRVLTTITERSAALILDVEPATREGDPINPYATIDSAWISREAYLLLTLSNWLLLGVSASIWLWQTLAWGLGRRAPPDPAAVLLWAFYGAFAIQGALSILADFSIGGNLQHRVFPSFTLLAVPLITRAVIQWQPPTPTTQRSAYATLALVLGLLAILSTLKATNEPVLSNKWIFYHPSELQAITWADTYLAGRGLWVGFDERLLTSDTLATNVQPRAVRLDGWGVDAGTRSFLISDVIRSRGARLGVPLPITNDATITYDNGITQIYRLRPETPYQR